MFEQLDIFDFDGTLFRSPTDTPENHKKYENVTGLPWLIDKDASRRLSREHGRFIGMRRGWFGRAETLEPPLVPNPAPREWFIPEVVEAFQASKANEKIITVIMTGRHTGLANQVLRICHDGKLVMVEKRQSKEKGAWFYQIDPQVTCLFLGQDGPIKNKPNKPTETLPWKKWIIAQYLEAYSDLRAINIWEDRDEHVVEFKKLNDVYQQTVTVNHVK
jgi:hypothetical protein